MNEHRQQQRDSESRVPTASGMSRLPTTVDGQGRKGRLRRERRLARSAGADRIQSRAGTFGLSGGSGDIGRTRAFIGMHLDEAGIVHEQRCRGSAFAVRAEPDRE